MDEKKKKGGEASRGAIFLFDRNSINCREDGANGRAWLLQEIWLSSIGTISNYRSKKKKKKRDLLEIKRIIKRYE